MSEQPKLERLLRLLMMLSGGYQYTIAHLAEKLDTTRRTIYRYLDTLRDAGFIIQKQDGRFSVDRESPYLKSIGDLLHFTQEESWILNKAILSLDDEIPVKQNLARKLYSLYDLKGVPYPVVKRENSERIIALIRAIEQKHQVQLMGYQSANSSTVTDRLVEPFSFTLNYGYIWCFEVGPETNKLFKTARITEVRETTIPWQFENLHRELPTDVFRISGKQKIPVVLSLTMRAASLLAEEYPQSEEFIRPHPGSGFLFNGWVSNFEGIGRFVLGLPGEVEVIKPVSLLIYLRQRLNKKFST
ncbi:MAG: transcriptional regulator [Bacteroidales bacterium]|nr:transcriptional regulator [Bacteroidales bacterium]